MPESSTASRSSPNHHLPALPPPDDLMPSATPARNESEGPTVRVERDVGDTVAVKVGATDGQPLARLELPLWLYRQATVRQLCAQFTLALAQAESDLIGDDEEEEVRDGSVLPFPPHVAG